MATMLSKHIKNILGEGYDILINLLGWNNKFYSIDKRPNCKFDEWQRNFAEKIYKGIVPQNLEEHSPKEIDISWRKIKYHNRTEEEFNENPNSKDDFLKLTNAIQKNSKLVNENSDNEYMKESTYEYEIDKQLKIRFQIETPLKNDWMFQNSNGIEVSLIILPKQELPSANKEIIETLKS